VQNQQAYRYLYKYRYFFVYRYFLTMNQRTQMLHRIVRGKYLQMMMLSPESQQKIYRTSSDEVLSMLLPVPLRKVHRRHYGKIITPMSSNTTPTANVSVQSATVEPTNDGLKQTVNMTFIESDGTERSVQAEIGKHLLDVAHDNHIDLEGACGGELSCSTCHLIFEPHIYETVLSPKLDEEQDMLDLAIAVTET
jgi:ferredoxin-2, mitochondrial